MRKAGKFSRVFQEIRKAPFSAIIAVLSLAISFTTCHYDNVSNDIAREANRNAASAAATAEAASDTANQISIAQTTPFLEVRVRDGDTDPVTGKYRPRVVEIVNWGGPLRRLQVRQINFIQIGSTIKGTEKNFTMPLFGYYYDIAYTYKPDGLLATMTESTTDHEHLYNLSKDIYLRVESYLKVSYNDRLQGPLEPPREAYFGITRPKREDTAIDRGTGELLFEVERQVSYRGIHLYFPFGPDGEVTVSQLIGWLERNADTSDNCMVDWVSVECAFLPST